jgi:thioredoxin 2
MGERIIIICPHCQAKNRVPEERLGDRPLCGKCRSPLPSSPAFPEGSVEVFDWNFKDEVLDFPGSVLLEFYAPGCGYCQLLAPIIYRLASEYAGRVKVAQMNVALNARTSSEYGILSTPSLFLFRRGKLIDRLMGAVPKEEIERRLRSIL